MTELTPEKVLELKTKYGQILRHVETDVGDLVFKPPSRPAYDKWQDTQFNKPDGFSPASNARELAQHCLCSPDYPYEKFVEVIDRYPGILQGEIMTAIGQMSGAIGAFAVKKL